METRAFVSDPITPEELRIRAGQYELPFDVLKIANTAGADVYLTSFTEQDGIDVAGSIIIQEGKPIIYVEKSHPQVRRRFTVAHEVGHLVLGHLSDGSGELIDDAERLRSGVWNIEERNANAYAAELLMPLDLLRQALRAGIRSVKDLSILFGVSEEAMRIRLVTLRRKI